MNLEVGSQSESLGRKESRRKRNRGKKDAWAEKKRCVAMEIVAWGIGRNGELTRKESGSHVSRD